MNWSHALLVVAVSSAIGSMIAVMAADLKETPRLYMVSGILFVLATISGALAAGLWR